MNENYKCRNKKCQAVFVCEALDEANAGYIEPHWCPFCGEPGVIYEDEDDSEDMSEDYDDEDDYEG